MSNVTHRSERRDRLDEAGYKLLWETQTIGHDGDTTVVSSWMPKYIPIHTNKGWVESIFESDFILVERFAPADDEIHPNGLTSTSIYLHGDGRPLPLDYLSTPPDEAPPETK
jgi:hypothetical protein